MRKTFVKSKAPSDQMNLQITSMADIFMILLVFMLKSYGSGVLDITSAKGVNMPRAGADVSTVDALKLEIATDGILVEGKPVLTMKNFAFDPKEITSVRSSKTLSHALSEERKKQMLIAKSNSDVKLDPRIIIVADQKVPFVTIRTVLASAAVNGYTDFKLAVVQAN